MLVKRLAVEGASLAYEEWGDGEPLVCLHGGMGLDSSYLRTPGILGLARPGRRVILYDQRGHGESGRAPIESCTHARWAADLGALARSLAPPPFALLGHSYGGFLALEYAVRRPETLSRLVLAGTSAGPVAGDWPHVRRDRDVEEFFRERWPRFFAGEDRHEEVLERLAFSWEPFEAAFHGELPRFDLRDRARSLDLPVLLVAGSEDRYRSSMVELAASMRNARLVEIPGTGHFPFLEAPGAFLAAVRDFLDAPAL